MLPFTPNITVLRMDILKIDPTLTQILSCAPLLRNVEVQTLYCRMSKSAAPKTRQALRSLPQSITWRPFNLHLEWPCGTSAKQCTGIGAVPFAGTPLAQAVSKLTFLFSRHVEPPIAALRATFPNVLHFELSMCLESMASSLSEAVAAWPMLQSISIYDYFSALLAVQQHLEAAARTAAEMKAGQPFGVVLRVYGVGEGGAARMDVLVAAIHNAGGGKVDVR